jgi:hypothetical protein
VPVEPHELAKLTERYLDRAEHRINRNALCAVTDRRVLKESLQRHGKVPLIVTEYEHRRVPLRQLIDQCVRPPQLGLNEHALLPDRHRQRPFRCCRKEFQLPGAVGIRSVLE